MNDVNEQQIAERIHRELRGLPHLKAPRTLAPRVLAAIAARQQAPWWKMSWIEWPAGIRMTFLALGILLAGGLVTAGLQAPQLAGMSGLTSVFSETAADWFAWLQPYLSFAARMLAAVILVLKAAPPQAMWGLLALLCLAYATCIGLGTLGYRVAFNRI